MSKQTTPAPGAPDRAEAEPALEIVDLLGQVVRRLHRGTSEALAPLGLSRAESRVVRLLAGGPLRMAAIAERLSVVPRTVTDLVDGVEAAGLVSRHPDPQDRRSTFVGLTASGRLLLDQLEVARRESAEQVLGRLDQVERAALLRLLRGLAEGIGDGCVPRARITADPAPTARGRAR
jgi:DNA-binding MarR family transcriptional regulator